MPHSFKLFHGRPIAELINDKKEKLETYCRLINQTALSKEEYIAEVKKRFQIKVEVDWGNDYTHTTRTEEIPIVRSLATHTTSLVKKYRQVHQFAFKCQSSTQDLEYFPESGRAVFSSVFNIRHDFNSKREINYVIIEISTVSDNPKDIQQKLDLFKNEVCTPMSSYIKSIKEHNDERDLSTGPSTNIKLSLMLHCPNL